MDRILEIINKLSSEKFSKQTVEDGLAFLEKNTNSDTVAYLIKEKGLQQSDATGLVSAINAEWIAINRHSIRLYFVFFLFTTFMWVGGVIISKPLFIIVGIAGSFLYMSSIVTKMKETKRLKVALV